MDVLLLDPELTLTLGSGHTLMLSRVALHQKDQVLILGVLLDLALAGDGHSSVHSASLGWYVSCDTSTKDLATVTNALAISRLDYCKVLYVGLPLELSMKLQLTQDVPANTRVEANKYEHITPVLQELHWFPIAFGAQFTVLVLTLKAYIVWDQDI